MWRVIINKDKSAFALVLVIQKYLSNFNLEHEVFACFKHVSKVLASNALSIVQHYQFSVISIPLSVICNFHSIISYLYFPFHYQLFVFFIPLSVICISHSIISYLYFPFHCQLSVFSIPLSVICIFHSIISYPYLSIPLSIICIFHSINSYLYIRFHYACMVIEWNGGSFMPISGHRFLAKRGQTGLRQTGYDAIHWNLSCSERRRFLYTRGVIMESIDQPFIRRVFINTFCMFCIYWICVRTNLT